MARLFAALELPSTFFAAGQRVLLKPNLLTDRDPEAATTTHPEVVRAVIHHLRPFGVDLAMADSPASAVKLQTVWQRTGFAALSASESVPLLNLEKAGSVPRSQAGHRFNIARPIVEADRLINLPKVKTHVLTTLTCGVKNLYGILPGYLKAQLHKDYPKPAAFGELLRAIHAAMPPCLTLADGVVGMHGEGPSNGTPIPLGFLAASTDAVALDLCLCRLLGIPPAAVPYLDRESRSEAYRDIQTVGDAPERFRPTAFKLPRTLPTRMIPDALVRAVAPLAWIRPIFNAACIRCGRCVDACPVQALDLPRQAPRPRLTGSRCIGCCCCHEICPAKAIEMRASLLLRLWNRLH